MSKKYGWLDYANLGVQMHQASQQAAMNQQLTTQTHLLQQEAQRKEQIVQARQYLVECERLLEKADAVSRDYPYYAIWRLEDIANGFRKSNLNSIFSEIEDLRATNELQKRLDDKVRKMHDETNESEDEIAKIRNCVAVSGLLQNPINCIGRNRELDGIDKRVDEARSDITAKNKQIRIIPIIISLFLVITYATGWLPQTDRRLTESIYECENPDNQTGCEYTTSSTQLIPYLSWEAGWNDTINFHSYSESSKHGTYWFLEKYTVIDTHGTYTEWYYGPIVWEDVYETRCTYPLYSSSSGTGNYENSDYSEFQLSSLYTLEDQCSDLNILSRLAMISPPEVTLIFLSSVCFFVFRRFVYAKVPEELLSLLDEFERNRNVIAGTIASESYISDENDIETQYYNAGQCLSNFLPTEQNDFI